MHSILPVHSQENARKPQILPVSLNQSGAKRTKFNKPLPKSTNFWSWSGYISMPNFRPFLSSILKKMPGNLLGWMDRWTNRQMDGWTEGKSVGWSVIRIKVGLSVDWIEKWMDRRTNRRKDRQSENIMPQMPSGGGINIMAVHFCTNKIYSHPQGENHILSLPAINICVVWIMSDSYSV